MDLDQLINVRSAALVIATRIQDHPDLLGIPRRAQADGPLPWLDPPRVGHPGWDEYLHARADLIADRARTLGNLTDAYREQYQLTHLPTGDLGARPEAGRRQLAYDTATRAQAPAPEPAPLAGTPVSGIRAPIRAHQERHGPTFAR